MTSDLISDLQLLVETTPLELMERICLTCERATNWNEVKAKALPLIHASEVRNLLISMVSAADINGRSPNELAFAMRAAYAVEARHRKEPQLELVWSGPSFQPFQVRRTDETLLEMIEQATLKLTLVSFALYKIDRLSKALTEAINRGVTIRLFLELDKINSPNIQGLYGDFLAAHMVFYTWSDQKRLKSVRGDQGILHAKTVVSDDHQLFVSSANLTEYAMSINIELGLLVRGGELPGQVERILDDYVERSVLVRHEL
jgi:phosphatidylserine/phosphatidylglycerophosphate/cardiolipin synthase-like enzyme